MNLDRRGYRGSAASIADSICSNSAWLGRTKGSIVAISASIAQSLSELSTADGPCAETMTCGSKRRMRSTTAFTLVGSVISCHGLFARLNQLKPVV